MRRLTLTVAVANMLVLMFALGLGISFASRPAQHGELFDGGIASEFERSRFYWSDTDPYNGLGGEIYGCGAGNYPLCPWQYLDPDPEAQILIH